MKSDPQIRDDVEAELEWDARVDSREIGVAAKNGVVTLTGHVGSYAQRRAAEEAAQSVEGVLAVANDIAIELPSGAQRTDSAIAQAAVDALHANVTVPAQALKISVHDGWVTLDGQVSAWHEKHAAEQALIFLRGVKGITNRVTIRSQISARDVQRKITEALHRRAQVDATSIHVTVADGTVTLDGEVDSWHERNQAEGAAWHAPGVTKVVDNLAVRP